MIAVWSLLQHPKLNVHAVSTVQNHMIDMNIISAYTGFRSPPSAKGVRMYHTPVRVPVLETPRESLNLTGIRLAYTDHGMPC
eukprot:scaffold267187_cov16-Prasinocladus_malaysianus.AAC.1